MPLAFPRAFPRTGHLDDQPGGAPVPVPSRPADEQPRQLAPQTAAPRVRQGDQKGHLDVSTQNSLTGRGADKRRRQEPAVLEPAQARHLEGFG